MNSKLCHTMAQMMSEGFRAYGGEITEEGYTFLGCNKRCISKRTEGF